MRKVLFVVLLLFTPAAALAQSISVSDAMLISSNAGEAQSTVVPPGHQKCPNGRFLVTNDRARPPSGVVSGRDLDQMTGTPIASTFTLGTLASNFDANMEKSKYFFGTNDHDLVTLPNGDVLYLTGAFSRMPLGSNGGINGPGGRPFPVNVQGLFADTNRNICQQWDAAGNCVKQYPFGPNVRSVMLVFRSKDCGVNFDFVSEMDPLRFSGGTCALPQFRRDANNNIIPFKPWDMGGTDGQLVKVDPSNGNIYMTFQCVGYLPNDSFTSPAPDDKKPINKTLVLMSDTGGTSWKSLGYIEQATWRFGIVPQANGALKFGYANSVFSGKQDLKGDYVFDKTGTPAPGANWTWKSWWNFGGDPKIPFTRAHMNIMGVPVLTRVPGGSKSVVLIFPDKFGDKGYGYHVFFYYPTQPQSFAEADSILPANAGASNVVFNLAVADPGEGPVLLYWTDFDAATQKATIRGRFVTGPDELSEDRVISLDAGADHSFSIPTQYWMGDYHTAGAFSHRVGRVMEQGQVKVDLRSVRYEFYPMWVETDGNVHYARVEYSNDPLLLTKTVKMKLTQLRVSRVPSNRRSSGLPPIELRRIAHPEDREPEIHRRVGLPDPPPPVRRRN